MKTGNTQKKLWLLAALSAPAAHFSGCGWFTAVLTALAILPLSLLPKKWEGLPKPIALAQILWLGIVAGTLLPAGAACWPSDNDLAVPLTLLALAAWTKTDAAPRIGAVLAFCMALLAIPLGIAAAEELKGAWLRPVPGTWSWGLATALLIPSLPFGAGGRSGRGLAAAGILTVLLAALVQGVLSQEVAFRLEDAFYQTARTLGHLEPIAAAGITLGWYALASALMKSAVETGKNSGILPKTATVLVTGTSAACILFKVQLIGPKLALFSAFFWVLIPFAAKINFFQKT